MNKYTVTLFKNMSGVDVEIMYEIEADGFEICEDVVQFYTWNKDRILYEITNVFVMRLVESVILGSVEDV